MWILYAYPLLFRYIPASPPLPKTFHKSQMFIIANVNSQSIGLSSIKQSTQKAIEMKQTKANFQATSTMIIVKPPILHWWFGKPGLYQRKSSYKTGLQIHFLALHNSISLHQHPDLWASAHMLLPLIFVYCLGLPYLVAGHHGCGFSRDLAREFRSERQEHALETTLMHRRLKEARKEA